MLEIVDKIMILKLKKNESSEMEKHIEERFPNKKYEFYEVEGKTINKNEGSINMTVFKIMKHDYIDDIVLDITKNHIEMIKKAYNENHNTVLFMEEDARIEKNNITKCNNVNKWLRTNNKWDIMYLGYCNWPYPISFMINLNVVKVWSPVATHCYILNRRGMQKILNYTENGKINMNMHIDKMYTKIPNLQKYAIFPMIAFQNKEPALFLKACDLMNIKCSMKTASIVVQYLSLLLPLIFIFIFCFFLIKLFF